MFDYRFWLDINSSIEISQENAYYVDLPDGTAVESLMKELKNMLVQFSEINFKFNELDSQIEKILALQQVLYSKAINM